MSIRFVSTSVLSSSDGVDFNVETKLETEEVKEARKAAERAANKPLFQQLAEREEAKKIEYDLNTRRMNAPPKALDEEDVNHLNSLAEKEQTEKQARLEQEELEQSGHTMEFTGNVPLMQGVDPSNGDDEEDGDDQVESESEDGHGSRGSASGNETAATISCRGQRMSLGMSQRALCDTNFPRLAGNVVRPSGIPRARPASASGGHR